MRDDAKLLDEYPLRASLRLEADEIPPRLDPALLAALAREKTDRSPDLALVAGVAFLGGWLGSEVSRIAVAAAAQVLGVDPLAAAIQTLTSLAMQAAPIVETLTTPAIPLAIAVVAALVIAFEQRRTRPA